MHIMLAITAAKALRARTISQWFAAQRAAWKQRAQARATYRALASLDARTLRDLGLDRSELMSIAAELTGTTHRTRSMLGLRGE